jgi:hypothetical protein
MRDGMLLDEAAPDALLAKYNKTSLEDVFLDLCRRQTSRTHASISLRINPCLVVKV